MTLVCLFAVGDEQDGDAVPHLAQLRGISKFLAPWAYVPVAKRAPPRLV